MSRIENTVFKKVIDTLLCTLVCTTFRETNRDRHRGRIGMKRKELCHSLCITDFLRKYLLFAQEVLAFFRLVAVKF